MKEIKEAIRNNKKVILIGTLVLLLVLLGTTFAYLTKTLNGNKEYIVRAGSLNLVLTEPNDLTFEKIIPIEDEEGLALNGFEFSVENKGTATTDYTVYLDDVELSNGETRMPDAYIRYSLDVDGVKGSPKDLQSMGSNPERVVTTGILKQNGKKNYVLRIWIEYNTTREQASGKTFKGKLRVVASPVQKAKLADAIVKNLGDNGAVDTTDTDETFITGTDPNNYVWYSGKLWRAMAINTSDSSVKLITQWAVSSLAYSGVLDSVVYGDSYIRSWLNDTSEDGFLGNLRDYNNFIETDSVWNATAILQSENTAKPPKTTLITDSVGLISSYEYAMTYKGATPETGYLNDGLNWWTINPMASSSGGSTDWRCNTVLESGKHGAFYNHAVYGVRPAVNLKSTVKIVDGDGSLDNPYRLENDNDVPESGTKLSTRYSGEYVKFGSDSKSLYRIVSHEFGGTKIVSDVPIEELGNAPFDNSGGTSFGTSLVKSFLNINFASGYLTADQKNMVESATWYLGTVGSTDSYLNAKYSDPANFTLTTTVYNGNYGLLRYGELMSGQFDRGTNNSSYWTLTPLESGKVRTVDSTIATGGSINAPTDQLAIKPAMNLKSSVVIVSGDGTKNNPFIVSLG